ncbi:MAG: hypothetical protein NW226_09880 [Microscillaceae bacterium]|nr:hypothetical protein [Microscillaceae bacterium]
MQIKIFINEASYHNQFNSEEDFDQAMGTFREILKTLFTFKDRYQGISLWIHKSSILNFIDEIEMISKDKFLKTDIERQIFEKLRTDDWEEKTLHSNQDKFLYLHWNAKENGLRIENFVNTSIAEISERILQYPEENYLLINFAASRFQEKKYIQIIKSDAWDNLLHIVQIDCIENHQDFETWFEQNHQLDSLFEDKHRFEKTKRKVQGRSVFKEIRTGYYWYYDNFHRDFESKDLKKPVEIEVFDSQGNHVGVADP